MDINAGFELDNPKLFVPWEISEQEFKDIFKQCSLCNVTTGYFTVSCSSLGGLKHELGFHFDPRTNGKLNRLEFFLKAYGDHKQSFDKFQRHLEARFGAPTGVRPGSEGFPDYEWQLGGVLVYHYIFDRFGLEEHVGIKKIS